MLEIIIKKHSSFNYNMVPQEKTPADQRLKLLTFVPEILLTRISHHAGKPDSYFLSCLKI